MLCCINLPYNFRVKTPFAPHSGGPRSAYGSYHGYVCFCGGARLPYMTSDKTVYICIAAPCS